MGALNSHINAAGPSHNLAKGLFGYDDSRGGSDVQSCLGTSSRLSLGFGHRNFVVKSG